MKGLRRSFKDISIFYRLFFCFAIVIAVLSVLTVFNIFSYYNQVRENALVSYQAAATQAANEIGNYLEDVNDLTKLPLARRIDDIEVSYALQHLDEGTATQAELDVLHELMDSILDYKNSVHSVFLVTPSGKFLYSFQFLSMVEETDFQDSPWFQNMLETRGRAVLLDSYLLRYFEDLRPRESFMFSSARTIQTVSDAHPVGIVLVNTDVSFLGAIASNMVIQPRQRIIIADQDGNTIFDTESSAIGAPVPEICRTLLTGGAQPESVQIDGTAYLASTAKVPQTDWTILNMVPSSTLSQQLEITVARTALLSLGIFFCVFFMALFFSRSITTPIQALVQKMNSIDYERDDVSLSDPRRDEIGQLNQAFTDMILKIRQLIKENYKDKLEQKESKIAMLQMQINPHFLYNTLESIGMMAEINDDVETANMISMLGQMMRYSLSNHDEFVLLSSEIYHLSQYINLQKERLTNVEFDEHIDCALYDQKVIRLILQPIVENAIYHGMDNRRVGGLITITGHQVADRIVLEVSDNGKGISPEALESLMRSISDAGNSARSIGLKNVDRRIKLYFGQEYGLNIQSTLGKGTTVQVILPFIPQ